MAEESSSSNVENPTETSATTTTTTTSVESTGIAPSNNFLGLLPPPYSMSSLKTSLPLFQTTSASSTTSNSSSSIYSTPISSTTPSTTNNGYAYRSSPSLLTESVSPLTHSSYSMSSSTYRPSINKPPSLFHQTKEKEKLELSTLNDKFADYVEKVRYLEAQNKKVQMETNLLVEKQQNHCQKVKSMFENEIAQLKELAEKLFKEKSTLAYAAKDAQNTLPSLRQRLNQTFKEGDSSKYDTEKVERQLSSVEGDILMYKRRLAHQDDEHHQWKQLITHIQRLLLQAKNETHNETLTRNSCEQAMKQLRVEIGKLREQQQQKLQDLKQNTFLFGPNANNDRAHMFKSELSSAIRKIRQDFERENDQQRNELYAKFTQSYEAIAREYPDVAHLFLPDREQERVKQEEDRIRVEIQRMKNDSNALKQKNAELKLRIRELQINLEMTFEENQRLGKIQQNEIDQWKLKQERVSKDYDEVINKQTSLEKEIETYRNLLEGTMKTMVDTITDEYNINGTKANAPLSPSYPSNRTPRSASVDRSASSSYLSSSRLNGSTPNAYSRFLHQKYTSETVPGSSSASSSVIEIPTTVVNGNGLAPSKSAGDLSVKNGIHAVEINGITDTNSSSTVTRPPTILQTRRS